jgi:hypothetical protein
MLFQALTSQSGLFYRVAVTCCGTSCRMLKKAVQQGRSERRGEEVQTALCVGRSPVELILANGKAPTVLPTSETP